MPATTPEAISAGAAGMREILFYYKEDCELCGRMAIELNRFLDRASLTARVTVLERDIEDDPDWFDRYREYVPVLVVNDEEVCHYFLDEQDLTEALRCNPHNPD